jgi:integrase
MNKKILSDAQYNLLMNHYMQTNYKHYLVLTLCARLGLRIGEACSLQKWQVDDSRMRLTTIVKKPHRKVWTIPIPEDLFYTMKAWESDLTRKNYVVKDYYFVSRRKNPKLAHIDPITVDQVYIRNLKKLGIYEYYVDKAGKKRCKHRIHDLRARFCTKLLDSNPDLPMREARFMTRHSSTKVLEAVYWHYSKAKIIDKLQEVVNRPTFEV